MSESQRICAFYSKGNHYVATLQWLRRHCPEAAITAIVPPGYALSAAARQLVNEVVETEQAHYTLRDFSAFRRLVRKIRAQRLDIFVVMFDSPRLRLLAAQANARKRLCYTEDGQRIKMDSSTPRVVAKAVLQLCWGHIVFATLWLTVRLFMTRPKLQLRRIARERK